METAAELSSVAMDPDAAARPQDALTEMVQRLAANSPPTFVRERRSLQRASLPFLLKLVPLDDQGCLLLDAALVVVGRDVTPRGISFFHHEPLHHRRAHITLDHPISGRLTVEVDVNRCRFHRLGWYESGGRLVRAVEFMFPEVSRAG